MHTLIHSNPPPPPPYPHMYTYKHLQHMYTVLHIKMQIPYIYTLQIFHIVTHWHRLISYTECTFVFKHKCSCAVLWKLVSWSIYISLITYTYILIVKASKIPLWYARVTQNKCETIIIFFLKLQIYVHRSMFCHRNWSRSPVVSVSNIVVSHVWWHA